MRKYALTAAVLAACLPLTPAMARSMQGYTVRSTTMFAGPDYNYPSVQGLRRDTGVRVYGCLRDRSWCDVSDRVGRGWVAGNDIVVTYQGRRQIIVRTMGIGILSFTFGSYWDSHYRSRPFYNQRPRYEQQYYTNHRPQWGPRPAPPHFERNRGPQYQAAPRQAPQQPHPAPARQQPQGNHGGQDHGNRGNAHAPGQQQGGPHGRPDDKQRPGN